MLDGWVRGSLASSQRWAERWRLTVALLATLATLLIGCGSARESAPATNRIVSVALREDPEGLLTIEDVADPLAASRLVEMSTNRGYTRSVWWGRVELELGDLPSGRAVLLIGSPRTDRLDLFVPQDGGGFDQRRSGDHVPLVRHEVKHRSPAFWLERPSSGRVALYFRAQSVDALQLAPELETEEAFHGSIAREQLLFGMYYGCVLALAAYNLFLFFAAVDRNYLYYVLYVLAFAGYQASAHGLPSYYLQAGWARATDCAPQLLGLVTLVTFASFTRKFLLLAERAKRLDRVLIGFQLTGVALAVAVFLVWGNAIIVTTTLVLIAGALCLITSGVVAWRGGYRPARLFVAAWSVFLWGVVLAGLKQLGMLPVAWLTEYGMQAGSVTEMLLLSLALADRINLLKTEMTLAQAAALSAQQHATANLEREVLRQTEALTRQKQALIEANGALAQIDAVKTRFFQNISHELRTPLTLMLGPAREVLGGQLGPLTDEQRDCMELLHRNASSLLTLINQLLDLSTIEAGRLQLELRPSELVSLLKQVLATFESLAARRQISLDFWSEEERVTLECDADKVEKIASNLIANALKYTPNGGRVALAVSQTARDVSFTVRDDGRGIAQADIPHVFDRFWRAHPAPKDAPSTGIGLSLVRDFAELHDGHVSVDSRLGLGSAFTVTLPRERPGEADGRLRRANGAGAPFEANRLPAEVPADPAPPSPRAGANGADSPAVTAAAPGSTLTTEPVNGSMERVLVVDDNDDLRAYMKRILEPHVAVCEAVDGMQALEVLETSDVALVLSDVMMPVLGGYGLLSRIRANPQTRGIPVVMVTARAGEESLLDALEQGADEYLCKPFDPRELLVRVKAVLRLRRQEARLRELNLALQGQVESQIEQLSRTKRLFGYTPKRLLAKVLSSPSDLGLTARRAVVTVLFADLVGFTSLTERVAPEVMMDLLNDFLGELARVIDAHGGTLVNVMGDGVMALWGAPDAASETDQALGAVQAAVRMQKICSVVQGRWRGRGVDCALELRIGIHSGHATVGNVGSADLMTYTAVGMVVNVAARLQAACSPGRILVGFPVRALTADHFPHGELVTKHLKGIVSAIRASEIEPSACTDEPVSAFVSLQ